MPTVEPIEVTDTLYSSTGEDSLVHRQGIRYLPNDVLLTWFNVNYKQPYLADYKRLDRRRISLTFGAPQDSLPELTIVDGAPVPGRSDREWALMHPNATGDSLTYWIADTAMVAHSDSLRARREISEARQPRTPDMDDRHPALLLQRPGKE